ncbi:hypothetical protein BDR22DRAFT_823677 [Usnea florida]
MASERSNNAVSKPFLKTGLGKLPPEIRKMIFINLLATPPPYAGHDFAINSAGPKNSASVPKKFIHIRASWHQVTRTCRQIHLEAYPLFFASESYYLANPQELKRCLREGVSYRITAPAIRHYTITTLCLEGFITCSPLYTNDEIDKILSNHLSRGRTRQQLEAETFKAVDDIARDRLAALPNLKTVGLRIRVGEEMIYVNLMYGVSGMRRGLVEFVDQSHWLIRNQHPNDVWRIQYACFTLADYGTDKNMEEIPYDRLRIEREVTDIDSRAPGLQEGDERYVEVQIQRHKREDKIRTTSKITDAHLEDFFGTPPTLYSETPDLNLNTSEPFVRSQSQEKHDSQSNEHSDQENDHALSEIASYDVSSIQSTEPSHQQAKNSLWPTYSTFSWHSLLTNTDSSPKSQTDSDDEDSNLQDESGLEDEVPQSTQNKATKAERDRRIRKRLPRQVQQLLSRFSDFLYPHTVEEADLVQEMLEALDLNHNEWTETGVREFIQSSTSEMREHGVGNPGATRHKATSMEKQPVTAFPEWIWSPYTFFLIWIILLTFCYLCLLVIFLTASLQNLHGS